MGVLEAGKSLTVFLQLSTIAKKMEIIVSRHSNPCESKHGFHTEDFSRSSFQLRFNPNLVT